MSADKKDVLPLIHLYAQYAPHQTAVIIGNREGIKALRDACDAALKEPGLVDIQAFVADGEGYTLGIIRDDQDWQSDFWQNLASTYMDETYNRNDLPETISPERELFQRLKKAAAKR